MEEKKIRDANQIAAMIMSHWDELIFEGFVTCIYAPSHCSRINRYVNFISWDFFHLSSFIHNGDNLDLQEKIKFHGEILKNLRFCEN